MSELIGLPSKIGFLTGQLTGNDKIRLSDPFEESLFGLDLGISPTETREDPKNRFSLA